MSEMTNGGYNSQDERALETDPRMRQVQAGLAAMQELQNDRDLLHKRLEETTARCRGTQAELDALNLAYQRLLGEIEQYRRERDLAVARRAEVEAIFGAALEIMTKYKTATVIEEITAAKVEEGTAEPAAAGGTID